MKKILLLLFILILNSCGICNHLPQEHLIIRDSLVIHYIDSTIYHHKTVNRDYTGLLDTLRIQGERSSMSAFADTTSFLIKGELKEEPYREKIVYKDRIQYRDSIQIKEVPVEVEKIKEVVPKWAWWLLFANVLVVIAIGIRIYLRFAKVR